MRLAPKRNGKSYMAAGKRVCVHNVQANKQKHPSQLTVLGACPKSTRSRLPFSLNTTCSCVVCLPVNLLPKIQGLHIMMLINRRFFTATAEAPATRNQTLTSDELLRLVRAGLVAACLWCL